MSTKLLSFIQVELTNHCNYRCKFCPQSHWQSPRLTEAPYDREKGFMPFDLFERIVSQAGEIAREINFSFFGEPMMHPEFIPFMDYLKNRKPGLKVVMNTNLSLATRAVFDKLIDIELDELRLSIDAATNDTYETVRPGEKGLDLDGNPNKGDRLDMVNKKAEYWFALSGHRPTRHVFTVNSKNRHEITAFAKNWLPRLGDKDTLLLKSILSYGGKIADDLISPNPCNVWDFRSLTVDWRGRVSPCNLDTNMDMVIGSAADTPLRELIDSEKMRQIERLSKEKKITPCRECSDANNWSRNLLLGKGDKLKKKSLKIFAENT